MLEKIALMVAVAVMSGLTHYMEMPWWVSAPLIALLVSVYTDRAVDALRHDVGEVLKKVAPGLTVED